jgi:catechol 2,3-dioxygenase-like lactoylglutathione lyase family enzyme
MIKGMHHVAISVTNLERAIAFYTKLLGMELTEPPFPLNGPDLEHIMALSNLNARMCVVGKGSFTMEVFEFAQPRPASKDPNHPVSDHGITHFGIEVTDIDAMYQRLVAAGVKFHSPVLTFQGGIKATYGRDLDGNVFELLEMPQRASG